jgi:hypothetical protein
MLGISCFEWSVGGCPSGFAGIDLNGRGTRTCKAVQSRVKPHGAADIGIYGRDWELSSVPFMLINNSVQLGPGL